MRSLIDDSSEEAETHATTLNHHPVNERKDNQMKFLTIMAGGAATNRVAMGGRDQPPPVEAERTGARAAPRATTKKTKMFPVRHAVTSK